MNQTNTAASLGLGLWGGNGHQIQQQAQDHPRLQLRAYGGFNEDQSQALHAVHPQAFRCETLEQLLATPGIELVSLCSPLRTSQADDAIAALERGIHVYAEKPCATTEADLDRLIAAAQTSNATFHEMAGTAFEQPYWAMRELVAQGVIGEVVQVSTQKSYPFYAGRPTDEAVDGGLVAQVGVHALRFVEHVAGVQALSITALSTNLGESRSNSDLKMAATMMGHLQNGGLFSVVANYLNPTGFGSWGNEMLRIFGTNGMLEATDGGSRTRLVVGDEDRGPIDTAAVAPDWLDCVIAHAADGRHLPFDLQTELHPTRLVLQATRQAEKESLCKSVF